MDLDCGVIISAKTTLEEMGREIYQRILDTASGRKTKSEAQGFGTEEFVPWTLGPVL